MCHRKTTHKSNGVIGCFLMTNQLSLNTLHVGNETTFVINEKKIVCVINMTLWLMKQK